MINIPSGFYVFFLKVLQFFPELGYDFLHKIKKARHQVNPSGLLSS